MSDKLKYDIGFLATKVRTIGEYLIVMEKGEMNHNEYHNIGEVLYCAGQRILELSEKQ